MTDVLQTIDHIDSISEVVRLVQITDTHLCAEQGGTLLGMDTDHSLLSVIDLVKSEREAIDLVLATGDLSDNGAPAAYERLAEYFQQFDCNKYWLPGNHDASEAMLAACCESSKMVREIRVGGWQIVMLDSQIPGEVGGHLGESELGQLESSLEAATSEGLHSLVVLHHHPVLTHCDWLDEQIVADTDTFLGVIDRFSCVKSILWGHVHQELDTLRKNVRLLSTPSSCVQFAPNSPTFRADDQSPGYRWLDLLPDGQLNTGVSRVRDVEFTVDLDSGGYL
jgi:3',5'-cyclic-AMP phosphodiesterase